MRRRLNIIGPTVARLRFERDWTQDTMIARMQCVGAIITRDVLANIELGRSRVTDKHLKAFQEVFEVQVVRLFPASVQELDAKLAAREKAWPAGRRTSTQTQAKK